MRQTAPLRAVRAPFLYLPHESRSSIPHRLLLAASRAPRHPTRSSGNRLNSTSSTASSRSPPKPTSRSPPVSLAANPPSSTRPPPLEFPPTDPATSTTFTRLLATGKAYLTFYKKGMRAIFTNYKLRRAVLSSSPETTTSITIDDIPVPHPNTRAAHQLTTRTRHDLSRVPIFALMLLLCGELTPFVVMALPRVVPFTCRIPRQVAKLDLQTSERRAAAFADLRALLESSGAQPAPRGPEREAKKKNETHPQQQQQQQQQQQRTMTGTPPPPVPDNIADKHIARSLNLVGRAWDRVGFVPSALARSRVRAHLAFLARDDALLEQAGGVDALVADEVVLACAERGIDVGGAGPEEAELRRLLELWLRVLRRGEDEGERVRLMKVLLTRPAEEWEGLLVR